MTNDQFTFLKRQCANYLRTNGIKPTTKTGRTAIHTFWYGAITALDESPVDARAGICLLSGRHEDLVDFTEKPKA